MAIEGILLGTVSHFGSGRQGSGSLGARVLPSTVSSGAAAVSIKRDHVSVAAAGRLAGQIAGLVQGKANAGTAKSLLEVADAGFEEIDAKLTRLKELAAQAASVKLVATDPTPPSTSTTERAILNEEFARLRAEIDVIATTTTFNDLQILNGSSGLGVFSAAFNVGGDSQAEDVITVSIEAGTAANLAAGLATADLSSVAGATAALTDVNAAISKLDEARADVRGLNVRLHAAASSVGERAADAETARRDRLVTRIEVDFSRVVAGRVLDDRGVSTLLHDTETIRKLLSALQPAVVRNPAGTSAPTFAGSALGTEGNGHATVSFASLYSGPQPGSRVDLEA